MTDPLAHLRRKTRLIAEARFDAIPEYFDIRGHIIATILPKIRERFPHWQSDPGNILFTDSVETPANEFSLGCARVAVILEDVDTVQEFLDVTRSHLQLAYDAIGKNLTTVKRFGVRFISILQAPGLTTHPDAVKRILETLHRVPQDVPLSYVDSLVRLVHERGAFTVGPVRADEQFISQVFKRPKQNVPEFGVLFDVDSNSKDGKVGSVDDFLALYDTVLALTCSVEESLARAVKLLND